jgi:hypothetical protein
MSASRSPESWHANGSMASGVPKNFEALWPGECYTHPLTPWEGKGAGGRHTEGSSNALTKPPACYSSGHQRKC